VRKEGGGRTAEEEREGGREGERERGREGEKEGGREGGRGGEHMLSVYLCHVLAK